MTIEGGNLHVSGGVTFMLKSWPQAAIVLFALICGTTAAAQQRVPAGSLMLSGYQATCGPVVTDIMSINDISFSEAGRIILNPILFDLPRAQQIFWYTHECAHQIFGRSEEVADCWAVEQGRVNGWLKPAEFERLAEFIRRQRGDATHAEGSERAAAMAQCYYR